MLRKSSRVELNKRAIDAIPVFVKHEGTTATAKEYSTTEPGLHICVNKHGHKRWVFRFRTHKKKMVTIGPYPAIDIPTAKEMVIDMKRDLALGEQVVTPKDRVRRSKTFAQLCDEYIEHSKVKNKSWKNTANMLNNELVKKWGETPLPSLTTEDVQTHLDGVFTRASGSSANRHYAVIRHLLSTFAVKRGYLDPGRDPMRGVTKYKENPGRTRFLDFTESRKFLQALETFDNGKAACALALLLLLGCRVGSLMKAVWSDLNTEKRTLLLRDTKNGKDHEVYLNDLSIKWVERLKVHKKSEQDWLFPSEVTGKHMKDLRKPFAKVVKASGIDPSGVLIHTLRHTHASGLVNLGYSAEVVKTCLDHSSVKVSEKYIHTDMKIAREASDLLAKELSAVVNG